MAHTILVVDDEKEVVAIVQKRLQQEGYAVAVAYDGEEALQKIATDKPDVVLLDLLLPKKNGFEVLQSIREKETEKWVPVIIVSAQNDLEAIKKSYHLEADHYLTKPCEMENILRGIRTMLSLMPARLRKK
jgi:DNA-binding response OmpR family regulator